MDEGGKRLALQFRDQVDDGLEVGLVNQARILLKRVRAVSHAIKNCLRLDGLDEIASGGCIVQVHRDDELVSDICQAPAFVFANAGVNVAAQCLDFPEQVGTHKPGCPCDDDRATQGLDVLRRVAHERDAAVRGSMVSALSRLATSSLDCLRKKPCDP